MPVKDYNTDPDMNTRISGINIAEGCAPSGIDNAIRQLMADVKAAHEERDSAQEERDAEQDEAISAAQSSADAVASETNLGRVKLSDSTSSTSAASKGIAASPKAVKDAYDKAVEAVPAGSVVAFAGNPISVPSGYLLCNGAAVSRATYAKLFEVIGTIYGEGNGSSTFNLPDLTDKFIQGSTGAGIHKEAGLPNIYGNAVFRYGSLVSSSGAFSGPTSDSDRTTTCNTSSSDNKSSLWLNAQDYNPIYGNSSTVQPPALTMRYYIKY